MRANDFSRVRFNEAGFELTGLLIGDYRMERRIGTGAMAEVWLARQCSLNRAVALKILRRTSTTDEICVRRFVYEAQAAARLEHPNIVHIYEVGSFPDPLTNGSGPLNRLFQFVSRPFRRFWGTKKKDACYYISEEYVDGLNLQQYLRQYGPLSVSQAFYVMLSIASALEKAASMDIVHRDIKPENILLGSSGIVKIADFGLARPDSSAGRDDVTLTQAGMAPGTPLYMSPEQSRGEDVDFRSDIYSFGVTSWQLLAGRTPYRGETPLAVVLEHLHSPVPDLREYRSEVPTELAGIIERMLAKKPEDRFPSFAELIAAIRTARHKWLAETPGSSEFETIPAGEDEKESMSGELAFKEAMKVAAASIQLQTRFQDLLAVRRKRKKMFSYRRWGWFAMFPVLGLVIGGLIALFLQNRAPVFMFPATASVERFATVEEQWVFATQLNTPESWKSIIDYFPEQEYWTRKASQQLARVYVLENSPSQARPLFFRFSVMPASESQYTSFGHAGLAWCMARDGEMDRAVAILSELRSGRESSFTPLTEELISRAQELIRNRKTIIHD